MILALINFLLDVQIYGSVIVSLKLNHLVNIITFWLVNNNKAFNIYDSIGIMGERLST